MSFVSSKGNILCRLIKIELYKIFAIINRARKGLHCMVTLILSWISNYFHYRVWGDITYPLLTFNVATVEVLEWIGYFSRRR